MSLTSPATRAATFRNSLGSAHQNIVNHALADGRIAERWAIRDDLGMLLQLGALRRAEDHT